MDMLNWHGFLAGLAAFAIIGLFHPVVIKMEYHLGRKKLVDAFYTRCNLSFVVIFPGHLGSILTGCLAFSLFLEHTGNVLSA